MEPVCDTTGVREAEAAAIDREGADILMQRAAVGVATAVGDLLHELAPDGTPDPSRLTGRTVLVVAGAGNNGGDALYAGARLAEAGATVLVAGTADVIHTEALRACQAAGGRQVGQAEIAEDLRRGRIDCVVDGVLGLGGRAGLRGPVAALAIACADRRVPVVAVDLPSGVVADEGTVSGTTFHARRTVTFGVLKPCHVLEPAASACGEVQVVDIGLGEVPPLLMAATDSDIAGWWPVPDGSSDKYSRGVVGLDAGSQDYPGAGLLAAYGATHSGAGMVRFTGDRAVGDLITAQLPNVVRAEGRVQARVLGPGWGARRDADQVVAAAIEANESLVIDADALRALPTTRLRADVLLTPHAGELARLLGVDRGEVTGDPLGAVDEAVQRTGATVLLKGSTQYVGGPLDPLTTIAVVGPSWTAQAGSGDVLAGICGALLAAGLETVQAALTGASIQAIAARRHPGPYPPQELARRLPGVIADLVGGRPLTSA